MKDALVNFGLSIVGCHVNPLTIERLSAILDYHQELGNKQIGCDIEFYPYKDMDYLRRRTLYGTFRWKKIQTYSRSQLSGRE